MRIDRQLIFISARVSFQVLPGIFKYLSSLGSQFGNERKGRLEEKSPNQIFN